MIFYINYNYFDIRSIIVNIIHVKNQINITCLHYIFWKIYSQNLQELQKLQAEYKKVLERQSLQKSNEIIEAERTAQSTAIPEKLIYSRKDVESLLVNTENLLKELRFFKDSTQNLPFVGYDFLPKDSIPFWQNLPLPKAMF